MSKPDFVNALKKVEERHAVQRHVQPETKEEPKNRQISRMGKVNLSHWVDPLVRKQLAQLALDADKTQAQFINEAFNLLFEKYGKPPIA